MGRLRRDVLIAGIALVAVACPGPATTVASDPPPTPAAVTPAPVTPSVTPTEAIVPTPSPDPVIGTFASAVAMGHVGVLEAIGSRLPGEGSGARTRQHIVTAFARAGWHAREETFELPQGGTSANVVATISSDGHEFDGPHLVIGAHWDTVPGTPGANDNATGVGVVLALAAELADEADLLALPVVLVGFGAEELQAETGVHHVGSEHMAGRDEHVVAMLSIDMVGNGATTRIVSLAGGDTALSDRLVEIARLAGVADITVDERGDISDHGPFARRGIPAAFLWTGPDGRLHTAADTSEHVVARDLQRAGDLVLAWVRSSDPYPPLADQDQP